MKGLVSFNWSIKICLMPVPFSLGFDDFLIETFNIEPSTNIFGRAANLQITILNVSLFYWTFTRIYVEGNISLAFLLQRRHPLSLSKLLILMQNDRHLISGGRHEYRYCRKRIDNVYKTIFNLPPIIGFIALNCRSRFVTV